MTHPPHLRTLLLPCKRGEVRQAHKRMSTEQLRDLAEQDLVLTRDGWVVKDRYGIAPREATTEEILLVTRGDEE